jgi:hypothetical protein
VALNFQMGGIFHRFDGDKFLLPLKHLDLAVDAHVVAELQPDKGGQLPGMCRECPVSIIEGLE